MKRSLTLLLTALLLVFSLTACGGDKQQGSGQSGENSSQNSGQTGENNGQTGENNGQNNGQIGENNGENNGQLGENNGQLGENGDSAIGGAITDGVEDARDAIDNAGDALTGDNTARQRSGSMF